MDVYGCLVDKTMIKSLEMYHQDKTTDTKSVLIMNTIHSWELLEKTTLKPTTTNVIRNTNSSGVTSIKQ